MSPTPMNRPPLRGVGVALLITTMLPVPVAAAPKSAQDERSKAGPSAPKDGPSPQERAKEAFRRGTKLVKDARWADALTSFEKAQGLVPHPVTMYNIGICLRAMGRYTAAREVWRKALEAHEDKRDERELPQRLVEDTQGYLRGLDRVIARVTVTVEPATAKLAVDGRPLSWSKARRRWKPVPVETSRGIPSPDAVGTQKAKAPTVHTEHVAVAGLRAPGPGETPPKETFVIELDPGNHVLSFERKGFAAQFVRQDFVSGQNPPMRLALDRLPATIRVKANVEGALVFLDDRDLGPAPVTVRRPAGAYALRVEREGFDPYRSELQVRAGEDAALRADLAPDEPLLVEQWWFWSAAAAVVAGAAVGTYFLVRSDPDPVRQPVSGGSLGVEFEAP